MEIRNWFGKRVSIQSRERESEVIRKEGIAASLAALASRGTSQFVGAMIIKKITQFRINLFYMNNSVSEKNGNQFSMFFIRFHISLKK